MKLFAVTSGRSTGTSCTAVLVLQDEDLGDDAVAGASRGRVSPVGPALVLASASGTIFTKPLVLDRRVALHAQRGEQDLVEHVLRHRLVGDDVHGAGARAGRG